MTYKNYTMNWDTSGGLSKSAMFAATWLIVLLMWSCGGQKVITQTTQNHVTDSVAERTTITVTPVKVPASQASLRLTAREVTELSPRAVYQEKSGQASVRVEYRDSLIFITATCDSLQVLCESKTREIYHLRELLEQQKTEITEPPGWWETFKNNAFYVIIGMVLMTLLTFIKKIWKKIKQPGSLLR